MFSGTISTLHFWKFHSTWLKLRYVLWNEYDVWTHNSPVEVGIVTKYTDTSRMRLPHNTIVLPMTINLRRVHTIHVHIIYVVCHNTREQ